MRLDGKVAIVTGAGQGIGREIALEFAKAGSNLALADIRENMADVVKTEIERMGRKVIALRVDVSKWEDAESMAKKTIDQFGQIDILVNNAGISPKGKGGIALGILDIEGDLWDLVMNVNTKGVFNCSKAVIPFMVKRRSGKIINIGSIAGLTGGAGGPASAPYCVSKAGVICLTKVMARELAQHNINVNAIAPGRILTEMAELTSPKANDEILKNTPLGKFGKPIDVARGVLFLAAESGDFITGETLVMDGGRTMH